LILFSDRYFLQILIAYSAVISGWWPSWTDIQKNGLVF